MNIMTAFLAEDLKKEIFMKQLDDFEIDIKKEDLIYRLQRSLYGLKQASRV